MPACLIAVAALGLPLLFVLYLHETDARRDLPLGMLVLAVVLGMVARRGLGIADRRDGRPFLWRAAARRYSRCPV